MPTFLTAQIVLCIFDVHQVFPFASCDNTVAAHDQPVDQDFKVPVIILPKAVRFMLPQRTLMDFMIRKGGG